MLVLLGSDLVEASREEVLLGASKRLLPRDRGHDPGFLDGELGLRDEEILHARELVTGDLAVGVGDAREEPAERRDELCTGRRQLRELSLDRVEQARILAHGTGRRETESP